MTNQPTPQTAVWIDGDPLMEAIAATVHEHCEHSDSGLVIDDPRNIAAWAAAAMRMPAVPVSSPPPDQTAVEERVARRLAGAWISDEDWQRYPESFRAEYLAYARDVLAFVPQPEPADRAAALSDAERTMLTYALDQAQEHIWSRDGFTDEDQAAITSLRRLTVEAQQPETPSMKLARASVEAMAATLQRPVHKGGNADDCPGPERS